MPGNVNNKVCEHCLKRRGEHYFTDRNRLICAPRADGPNGPFFQWNGLYSSKQANIKDTNPNKAFRRKKHGNVNNQQ